MDIPVIVLERIGIRVRDIPYPEIALPPELKEYVDFMLCPITETVLPSMKVDIREIVSSEMSCNVYPMIKTAISAEIISIIEYLRSLGYTDEEIAKYLK